MSGYVKEAADLMEILPENDQMNPCRDKDRLYSE